MAIHENPRTSKHHSSIYSTAIITRHVTLPINLVGSNIKSVLMKEISSNIEGRCIVQGFVKPDSTTILSYSCGVVKGANVVYEVVFECEVCCPVEGMNINCIAKNITKAGIRAVVSEIPSPVVIFVARDHHKTDYFTTIKEDQSIKVRVIGQRFELNDKYVSIIAELVETKVRREKPKIKPGKLKKKETKKLEIEK